MVLFNVWIVNNDCFSRFDDDDDDDTHFSLKLSRNDGDDNKLKLVVGPITVPMSAGAFGNLVVVLTFVDWIVL